MTLSSFFLHAWDWKPLVIAGCAALIAAAFRRSPNSSANPAPWLTASILLLVLFVSPVDELADRYLFSVHMAKHILLVLVIPALLVMGLPEDWAPSRGPGPALAWAAGVGAMFLWHLPILFNAALANRPLHIVEHLTLLGAGILYWWPILSPRQETRLDPVPQAAAYLFTSCLACTSLGVLITFSPRLLYPAYAHPSDAFGILPVIRNRWGISPQMDQQIGGLFMWVPACLVYLSAIMAMFARWYDAETSLEEETQWT